MDLLWVVFGVQLAVGASIVGGSTDVVASTSCYSLTNGHRELRPSSAVDPNWNYWQFAELSHNGTSPAVWKLVPTVDSCFQLCDPRTGLYLMVAQNDLTYTVPRTVMQGQPREAFTFGPHYPQWPATLDALITNRLKLHQLCASLDAEPNPDRLIMAYPQRTAALHRTECRWRLQPTVCPRPDCCQ